MSLTIAQIDELFERSKNDRAIIVGSEVRQLCELARLYFEARDEALEKAARFVETRELLFARCRASGATREVDDIKEYLVRGIRGLKGTK